MNYYMRTAVGFFSLLLLWTACSRAPKNGSGEKDETPIDTFRIDAPTVANALPSTIAIYLDCSGSMKGYVNFDKMNTTEQSEFKKVVLEFSNFAGNMAGQSKVTFAKAINSKIEPVDSKVFIDAIADGSIFKGKETPLDKILPQIIETVDKDLSKLAIFVSDCVLSFSPEEVKASPGRMKNYHDAQILKANLQRALGQTKNKQISMALVKYESNFNGSYYYNCKEEVPFVNKLLKRRPFYFCVMGREDLLANYINNAAVWPKAKKSEVFIQLPPIEMQVAMWPQEKRSDNRTPASFSINKKGEAIVAVNGEAPKSFYLGVKPIGYPPIYDAIRKQTMEAIKSSSPLVKSIKPIDKSEMRIKKSASGLKSKDDYTHFFEIELDADALRSTLSKDTPSEITFFIEPKYTLDIKQTSTLDDFSVTAEKLEGKTWGVDLFTQSIVMAKHNAQTPTIATCKINLLKY